MKVILHPAARAEHLHQIAYYEGQSAGLGSNYQKAVRRALDVICEAPHRYPIVSDPEVRRFSVKRFPFTVYYRHLVDVVFVLAVAPHRKSPGYWRGRI